MCPPRLKQGHTGPSAIACLLWRGELARIPSLQCTARPAGQGGGSRRECGSPFASPHWAAYSSIHPSCRPTALLLHARQAYCWSLSLLLLLPLLLLLLCVCVCRSLGAAAQQAVSREVHADVGYAHLSIPRVELVVWPRGRPSEPAELTSSPAAAAPASSSMDAAVAAVAGGVAAAAGEAGPVAGDPQACSAAVEAAEGAAAGSGAALALVPVATPDLQPGVPLPLCASAASEPALGGGAASGMRRKHNGLAELQGHITELTGRWWDKVVQR
jgi:hypothetical protein